jgi:hypothetical protein
MKGIVFANKQLSAEAMQAFFRNNIFVIGVCPSYELCKRCPHSARGSAGIPKCKHFPPEKYIKHIKKLWIFVVGTQPIYSEAFPSTCRHIRHHTTEIVHAISALHIHLKWLRVTYQSVPNTDLTDMLEAPNAATMEAPDITIF